MHLTVGWTDLAILPCEKCRSQPRMTATSFEMGGFCCSLACSLDSPEHHIPSPRPLQEAVDWQPNDLLLSPPRLGQLHPRQNVIITITIDLRCRCPAKWPVHRRVRDLDPLQPCHPREARTDSPRAHFGSRPVPRTRRASFSPLPADLLERADRRCDARRRSQEMKRPRNSGSARMAARTSCRSSSSTENRSDPSRTWTKRESWHTEEREKDLPKPAGSGRIPLTKGNVTQGRVWRIATIPPARCASDLPSRRTFRFLRDGDQRPRYDFTSCDCSLKRTSLGLDHLRFKLELQPTRRSLVETETVDRRFRRPRLDRGGTRLARPRTDFHLPGRNLLVSALGKPK